MFRGLVGGKTLTEADLEPVLEKLQDHLIGKNVAAEIAGKLCHSVGKKLEGKVSTFRSLWNKFSCVLYVVFSSLLLRLDT